MTAFAEACARRPFSNGTEGEAWTSKWCNYCARDHDMHWNRETQNYFGDPGEACQLILQTMLGSDSTWPEGWLPEPDDGDYYLPSRIVCTAFTPCEPCGGDPGTKDRAERVAEVTAYWKGRGA